ncbi:MAG: mechanosensitive ion channel domain-containing protein [Bdellovibrionales bacterium]
MKRISTFLCSLIVLAGLFVLLPSANAQQPAGLSAPPQAAKTAPVPAVSVPLTPAATQLGQTLHSLVAPPPSAPAPAEASVDDVSEQIADTFATNFLNTLAKAVDALKIDKATFAAPTAALSDLNKWIDNQTNDSRRMALWNSLGKNVLVIVVPSALLGIALFFFFVPVRRSLKRKRQSLPEQVGLLLGLFFLRLVPVLVFLGAALLLLEQNETQRIQRFVILNVIYALSLSYALRQVLRGLFSPSTSYLRILPLSTPQAISACRWLNAFNISIICGYFLIDVAAALRVPASFVLVFQNVFAVSLTVLAIAGILRMRLFVAGILRGTLDEKSTGFVHALRLWLARRWFSLAIIYLIISLIVILVDIKNSFALILRGTILSIIILFVARLGFVGIEAWKTPRFGNAPLLHRQVLAFFLGPVLWIASAAGIAATWGVNVKGMLATPLGQRFWGAFISIALTLLLLTFLYELVHGAIDRHLGRREKDGKTPTASARAHTLLPMVRTSIFILLSTVAVLTCLSVIGVDIAPLLAGAGIVGVAIGFGSQTLVKDFLTGLFIVAENAVAVGDIVKIDDFGGMVEALNIRTIRLRDIDGALHILPFSEVTKITNMSRGFAYALVDIGVSYDCDIKRVMEVLREIGADLQEDPVFKRTILEPIEVMGLEKFESSSIVVRARLRTRPGKQNDVRRQLLLRIKQRFDKEHIEIPFQTITQIIKSEK